MRSRVITSHKPYSGNQNDAANDQSAMQSDMRQLAFDSRSNCRRAGVGAVIIIRRA
jgi:hypothetical protein